MARVDHWSGMMHDAAKMRAADKAAMRLMAIGFGACPSEAPTTEVLEDIKDAVGTGAEIPIELCQRIAQMKIEDGPFLGKRTAVEVAKAHGFLFRELVLGRRYALLVRCRQHAMYEIHHRTTLSLSQIGQMLGNRDHTTVLYGIRRHQERLDAGEYAPVSHKGDPA